MYIVIRKDKEIWKPLKAYNIKNKYEISNYGNIRTKKNHKSISNTICRDGYLRVSLRLEDGGRECFLVHRLVAFIYVDGYNPITGKVIVNHLDSDRSNSYYENLEWVTYSENIKHGYDHGRIFKYTESKPINKKYDDEIIHSICGYLESGYSPSQIFTKLNRNKYSKKSIIDLINRLKNDSVHMYKDITKYYTIPKPVPQNNLTNDIVYKICELLSKSYSTEDIIRELNIHPTQVNKYRKNICDIKYHRTFRDISSNFDFPYDIYERKSKYDDTIVEICEQLESGATTIDITNYIVNKYNYNRTKIRDFIYDIKRRRIHTDISQYYIW